MKELIEDTVVISSSEDGMVHCIFDFVHGYLSNCNVQLFAGHKQCLHSSGVRELLSNDDGNSNEYSKKTIGLY